MTYPADRDPSLSSLVQMRASTDLDIPARWLLLPLSSYLVWAIIAIAWWSGGTAFGSGETSVLVNGLAIVGLATSACGSYLLFRLVNRYNEHCNRTRALFLTTIGPLESRSTEFGQNALLSLNSAEDELYHLSRAERDRAAVLWALLAIIPFVGWLFFVITLWRLTRDFAEHSRLEALVIEDFDRTLKALGSNGILVRSTPVSRRDFLGILILVSALAEIFTAVPLGLQPALVLIYLTVGALALFWTDLSIRDPIAHFGYHSQMEADLLKVMPSTNARIG